MTTFVTMSWQPGFFINLCTASTKIRGNEIAKRTMNENSAVF